ASSSGSTPKPADGPSTGGTGIGAGGADCAAAGATSTAGSTQPPAGACAAAAADPQSAAAGAPPVSAVRAAQGLICWRAGAAWATAAVELKIKDPATTKPMKREQAILRSPGAAGERPRDELSRQHIFSSKVALLWTGLDSLHRSMPSANGSIKCLLRLPYLYRAATPGTSASPKEPLSRRACPRGAHA